MKSDSDYKGYRFSIGNAHAPGGKFFAYGSLVKRPDCVAMFESQEGLQFLSYSDCKAIQKDLSPSHSKWEYRKKIP